MNLFKVWSQPPSIARIHLGTNCATWRITRATLTGRETARSLAASTTSMLTSTRHASRKETFSLGFCQRWGEGGKIYVWLNYVNFIFDAITNGKLLKFTFSRYPGYPEETITYCQSYVFPNFKFEETTVTKFNMLCNNTDFAHSVSLLKEIKSISLSNPGQLKNS